MELQPIYIYDPAWSSTFPHLVAPQFDEWFPGLLLRCDQVNDWDSGTTMVHLIHSIKRSRTTRDRSNWIIVPLPVLELLTQLLALPMSSLLATTYQLELARLYDVSSPHATFLGRSFPFHFCPDCITEGRLLKRTLTLPHITCCLSHQVTLVGTCQCGTPLQLFPRQSLPFTCQKCCFDWANLPRLASEPERIALEEKLLSYYVFFFDNARPTIIAKAQQLVRNSMKRKKVDHLKCFDGNYKYVELYNAKRISLSSLVELLISLDISPHDIVSYEGHLPWWSVKNRDDQRSARDNNNELLSGEGL